jgi:P27 family predicted phage terminase small subunit
VLKLLEGNPGHRPVPPDPRPERITLPRCPRHVYGDGRREWNRIAKAMHEAGLLTQLDRAALAAYCAAYGRWVQAEDALRAVPVLLIQSKSGGLYQNPYLSTVQSTFRDMLRAIGELGLSPTSRPRAAGAGAALEAGDPIHSRYGL